jgi:hypothetical protein
MDELKYRRYADATIKATRSVDEVKAYLPENYEVFGSDTYLDHITVHIRGYDYKGWTLEDYVIPRLASGLIFANERISK